MYPTLGFLEEYIPLVALDSVEVISIMEESNMITSNTSMMEEASSPNIYLK